MKQMNQLTFALEVNYPKTLDTTATAATRRESLRNATLLLFQWSAVVGATLHSTISPALLKSPLHKNLFNLSPPIPQSSP